jgi:hypothetical protein
MRSQNRTPGTPTCSSGGFSLGLLPSAVFEAEPRSLVIADVNGDGRTDLVATLRSMDVIAIALGNGDGTFVQGIRIHSASHPSSTVVADLDGDGWADLATVSTDADTMTIFLGNGDGDFREGASHSTGRAPFEIVAGDSNGDGAPDLVVRGNNTLDHWLNRGDGTFIGQLAFASTGSSRSRYATMAAGDFNGDGRDDLAVANGSSSDGLALYLARADGTFGDATMVMPGRLYDSAAVGDLDGDGRQDLAGLSGHGVTSLLNRGDGNFVAGGNNSSFGVSTVLGDVDGDGFPDLVVPDDEGSYVRVDRNRGDDTFEDSSIEPRRSIAVAWNGRLSSIASTTNRAG